MKAKEVLERAVRMWNEEHDSFYMTSLICGIGRSKVCIEGQEHNVYIVLDVIHEEYRKQPRKEKNLDILFCEGMKLGLTFTDIRVLKAVLDILTDQMEREKKHKAPFQIDAAPLLAEAGGLVGRLEEEGLLTDEFDREWIDGKRSYLKESFGVTF